MNPIDLMKLIDSGKGFGIDLLYGRNVAIYDFDIPITYYMVNLSYVENGKKYDHARKVACDNGYCYGMKE